MQSCAEKNIRFDCNTQVRIAHGRAPFLFTRPSFLPFPLFFMHDSYEPRESTYERQPEVTVPFVVLFLLLVLGLENSFFFMSGDLPLHMRLCQMASKEKKSTSGCHSRLTDVCARDNLIITFAMQITSGLRAVGQCSPSHAPTIGLRSEQNLSIGGYFGVKI